MPLQPKSFFGALLPAVGLSAAALAAAVILQGAILFPQHLRNLSERPNIVIRRVMPFADGTSATLTSLQTRRLVGDLGRTLGIHRFVSTSESFNRISFAFTLWNAASSRSGDRLFLSSLAGGVYSLDLRAQQSTLHLLGTHPAGYADLECSADGSFAFATNQMAATGWRFGQPGPLWQRTDIVVTAATFHPTSPRLFCGLDSGQAVELDPNSGTTLREFRAHWDVPIALDVSADGQRIAALGDNGSCVVTDLECNRPLWERRFPMPFVCPRFSPDGNLLLTPSPIRAPCINVVSTSTGELVSELVGAKAEIAGIAVSPHGLVYAWDAAGAITVWNLASRDLLHQFHLECLPETTPSS